MRMFKCDLDETDEEMAAIQLPRNGQRKRTRRVNAASGNKAPHTMRDNEHTNTPPANMRARSMTET